MRRIPREQLIRMRVLLHGILYFFNLYELEQPSAIAELLKEVNTILEENVQ